MSGCLFKLNCFLFFAIQVVPITTKLIHFLSAIRVYIPNDLRSAEHRLSVLKSLQVRNTLSLGQSNF